MKNRVVAAALAFLAGVAGTQPAMAKTPAASASGGPAYTLADVARHADARSCWMAIDGVVHDLTAYLPTHPTDPKVIARHCGRDASEAFRTKDAGRPHSSYARQLLDRHRIGVLAR